ncbi:IucA/IucC family protein [Undibacterium sp. TS12]|uniref:IucA/IucC family protein n=1 Tax=Undibacterium sp. TS12 TaxID=2908202 RepID=UPI001F4C73C9|nr:IucA/IucC family protein [Undibacterium sp. TS12]MCH8619572.1 IucA/IucC family siderophore biosynthesis protein [Undibacterium sp. TS12]
MPNPAPTTVPLAIEAAIERTLRQFIESFYFEGALDAHLEHHHEDGGRGKAVLHIRGRNAGGEALDYQIAAHTGSAFGRTRLLGPLLDSRTGTAQHDIASVAGHLLRHLRTDDDKVRRFTNELLHTAAKQARSLTVPRRPALELPYAKQEALFGEGHLYHPCYRSRIGFSLDDHAQYGPEFGNTLQLRWLAIRKDICDIHSMDGRDYASFLAHETGSDELHRLEQQVRAQSQDPAVYYLLPVHPWHWQHSLQIQYAHWLADATLLDLGAAGPDFLPQQSIRSLSNLSAQSRYNLKLPLAIANSSADRILSDHHVCNAPLISAWLEDICQHDPYLRQSCRFSLLSEPMGITLKPGVAHHINYGLLGAIWRTAPTTILQAGEQVFPCTALTAVRTDGTMEIAPWLQQNGTENWVTALLKSMLPPFLHLMLRHGVLLEAHAQNTLLILKDGMPAGVAIRDLPGGLHYIAGHTTDEARISQLRNAPAHRNAANASTGFAMHSIVEARDYLLEVLLFIHLGELAYRLDIFHGFSEDRFWQLAVQAVANYQQQVPDMAERFALFDLHVAEIQLERLATRRLSAGSTQQFHAAPNPLHAGQAAVITR